MKSALYEYNEHPKGANLFIKEIVLQKYIATQVLKKTQPKGLNGLYRYWKVNSLFKNVTL